MSLTSVYVDIAALQDRLQKFGTTATPNEKTLQLGINEGDRYINRKLREITIPTPIPDELKDSATYRALSDILISKGMERKEILGSAVEYKARAKEILEDYLSSHPEEKEIQEGKLVIGGVVGHHGNI